MRNLSLNQHHVDRLKPLNSTYDIRDTDLKGFGIRILPSGKKTYFLQTQHEGQRRWTRISDTDAMPEAEARSQARTLLAGLTKGRDTPLTTVVAVPVERLVLDQRNPRLIAVNGDTSDEEIIAQLYRAEDLGELLQSIAANGYQDIEPLIVLEERERLVVLEGNRRLAAIRLFREPELAARITQRERLRINLPEISEEYRTTLDRVSVYRVDSREDARSFIGFKHINGAAKWESYAKAKFAADWYRGGEISLSDIASRVGDKHDTVKRMVNAIYVLEQAQSENIFHVDNRVSTIQLLSPLYGIVSGAVHAVPRT